MDKIDKKICHFCGKPVNLLSRVTVRDGCYCRQCFAGRSPLLQMGKGAMTTAFLDDHLRKRMDNSLLLGLFSPDIVVGDRVRLFADTKMGAYAIVTDAGSDDFRKYRPFNPDLFFFEGIVDVTPFINERRTEILYYNPRSDSVEYKHFHPRVYACSFDFTLTIRHNHAFAPDITLNLNQYEKVDAGQPTRVDISHCGFSLLDLILFRRRYRPYKGRTDNRDRVLASYEYRKYSSIQSGMVETFGENIKSPVKKPDEQFMKELRKRANVHTGNPLDEALAKFAVCIYIARADHLIYEREKELLDDVFRDISSRFPVEEVRDELLKIANTKDINFIFIEQYLQKIEPRTAASYLMLAEEIASSDGKRCEEEEKRIHRIRQYLEDRSGEDFSPDTPGDLDIPEQVCPNCGSRMKVVLHNRTLECISCGYRKLLKN